MVVKILRGLDGASGFVGVITISGRSVLGTQQDVVGGGGGGKEVRQ